MKSLPLNSSNLFSFRQSKQLTNDDTIDDQNEEMMTKMMSSQMYLAPLDALKDPEQIWSNEKEVLAVYLATLHSAHHSITQIHNNPISLFFFEGFTRFIIEISSCKFSSGKKHVDRLHL